MSDEKMVAVKHWVYKAELDFSAMVELLKVEENILSEIICFHAQQCVEKYLKAYLIFCEQMFPKTHNLETLIKLCSRFDNHFLELDVEGLSEYGVEIRYDSFYIPTLSETKEAFNKAEVLKEYVRDKIRGDGAK